MRVRYTAKTTPTKKRPTNGEIAPVEVATVAPANQRAITPANTTTRRWR
jgi:hypothetical protein